MRHMKNEILSNLDNPAQLERLYRSNKSAFKRAFKTVSPEFEDNHLVQFWRERLNYTGEEIAWGTRRDLAFVIIASLLAGVIAKLPEILSIEEEFFYPRNIGFIVFPPLLAYFAWKNKLLPGKIAVIAGVTLIGVVFINAFPDVRTSDTLILSCVHLVLFLWSVLGFAFVGETRTNDERRLGFLRYNGELVVIATLIVIAGGVMSGVTIGLFALIGFQIEKFYADYVIVFGLAAVPIIGTYLILANPQLVSRVSPVIAKIFSPLVLVMLLIYLVAILYSQKDPFHDREFLLMFNALLVGVMAIIFFSVAGISKSTESRTEIWVLCLLSAITVIVNGIALSAILFRISEWGVTPNRAAVMGGNVLILINLLLVTGQLVRVLARRAKAAGVGRVIARYLPVYFFWTIIVTFLFPLIFGFK